MLESITRLTSSNPSVVKAVSDRTAHAARLAPVALARPAPTRALLDGPSGARSFPATARAPGATVAPIRPHLLTRGKLRSLAHGVDGARAPGEDGTAALVSLHQGIDAALARGGDRTTLLASIEDALRKFLANPSAIDEELILPRSDRYSRTLLYKDPEKRYLIALLTWSEGQMSPAHDHGRWCVVGVLRGSMIEIRYNTQDGKLVACPPELAERGAVTSVDPPKNDVHKMGNAGTGLAVTIHIYEGDMRDANVYDLDAGTITRKPIGFDAAGPLARLD